MLKDETHATKPANLLNRWGYQIQYWEEIKKKSLHNVINLPVQMGIHKIVLNGYLGQFFLYNLH